MSAIPQHPIAPDARGAHSLDRLVGRRIEAWKKRHAEDVEVRMRCIDGSYYRNTPAQWFGETRRFRVGPYPHIDDVLSELTRLHSRPNVSAQRPVTTNA